MYGQEIIGKSARRAPRGGNFAQAVQRLKAALPYRVLKDGDAYTVEICLPTRDGKVITCRGSCSAREGAHELGYTDSDLDTLRAIEASIPAWSEPGAIGGDTDSRIVDVMRRQLAALENVAKGRLTPEARRMHTVAWWRQWGITPPPASLTSTSPASALVAWWNTVPPKQQNGVWELYYPHHVNSALVRSIGHAIANATHSKAFRSALYMAAKVATSPQVMSSLGMLTGGAAIPALIAAKSALDMAHLATTAANTPEGQAAKRLLKVSSVLAQRATGAALEPEGGQLQTSGALRGTKVTESQKARIMALAKVVNAAKARRRMMAASKVHAVKKQNAELALPSPKLSDVVKYTVALRRTA